MRKQATESHFRLKTLNMYKKIECLFFATLLVLIYLIWFTFFKYKNVLK